MILDNESKKKIGVRTPFKILWIFLGVLILFLIAGLIFMKVGKSKYREKSKFISKFEETVGTYNSYSFNMVLGYKDMEVAKEYLNIPISTLTDSETYYVGGYVCNGYARISISNHYDLVSDYVSWRMDNETFPKKEDRENGIDYIYLITPDGVFMDITEEAFWLRNEQNEHVFEANPCVRICDGMSGKEVKEKIVSLITELNDKDVTFGTSDNGSDAIMINESGTIYDGSDIVTTTFNKYLPLLTVNIKDYSASDDVKKDIELQGSSDKVYFHIYVEEEKNFPYNLKYSVVDINEYTDLYFAKFGVESKYSFLK